MAKEYIERGAILSHLEETREGLSTLAFKWLIDALIECYKTFPEADVVEVVRCKDCRMFVDNKSALTTYCTRECKNLNVKPDDFCSYGERKCEE